KPDLTVRGLAGELSEVRLETLGHDAIKVWRAADVPGDGHLTDVPAIQGAAVRLAISVASGQRWPKLTVASIAVEESPTFVDPEQGALAIAPGETIDTVFPDQRYALFVKIGQIGHDVVDLVAFGAGDLRVADPAGAGFVLGAEGPWDVLALDRTGGASMPPAGMLHIPSSVTGGSAALRVAWVPPDAAA